MQTIPQRFKETAETYAHRPALKYKYHGAYVSISFSDLAESVETLAKGLRALGVSKGDRVAILSENRPEWVRTDLAALTLGAVTVPVHTTLSPLIIRHILNDSGSKVLMVSSQEQFNKVALVAGDLPELEAIIFLKLDHPENFTAKKLLSLEAVMVLGKDAAALPAPDVAAEDLASLVYTSGTTAVPKGVMLTHRNFMFDAEAGVTALPVTENDVLLSFLPLSHVLERTAGYYAPLVCRGCCIAYAESVKTLVSNLKEVKPTILVSVPRIFEKVHVGIWEKVKKGGRLKRRMFLWALKQEAGTTRHFFADHLVFKKIRASFGGRLRFTISGGATLNHKLARFFARLGIVITEGYGLTETAPVCTVNRLDNIKYGTVGQQLPGVEILIGRDKEILIKGPNVMAGYYRNEALTREVIDADGWFHTGDLGFLTNDGFLIIIGRKKEMISLSSGKIAWPEQLELILNNDRFIVQSLITGDGRSYLTAVIIPDWPEVLNNLEIIGLASREPAVLVKEEKLLAYFKERVEKINGQLADWEKIRKFVLAADEFTQEKDELTPTLKLRRHVIEEHYQKEIDGMYQ